MVHRNKILLHLYRINIYSYMFLVWFVEEYKSIDNLFRHILCIKFYPSLNHIPYTDLPLPPLPITGADPNAPNEVGRTALWRASFNGHANVIQLLLEAGGG
jgi:hypothetical protein